MDADGKVAKSDGELAEMEREIEEMKEALKQEHYKKKDITRKFLEV